MEQTLLITKREDKILSLLYQNNRLIQANAYAEIGSDLEAIYIGKVKNVVSSLEAAFVEYKPNTIGFLPIRQVKNPILTNRTFDGRLAAGDEVVVQVEKEGIKTKAPSLTCNLSFTGKYSVITTGRLGLGFSTKLSVRQKEFLKKEFADRRLEAVLEQNSVGMVIRTNAGEAEDIYPIWEEVKQFLKKVDTLRQTARHRTCFSLLYQPIPAYLMGIRDLYGYSYDKMITDDAQIFNDIKSTFPALEKLQLYQDEQISLSRLYSVEARLQEALREKVWMANGAYLIIQPTEALTVIDVNSGKNQKKGSSSEVLYQINREAAEEIALQLKLRNISGIIIIDFINQTHEEQDRELLHYLTRLVNRDSVKTTVVGMTSLGLVEVTRKKINKPLWEQLKIVGK